MVNGPGATSRFDEPLETLQSALPIGADRFQRLTRFAHSRRSIATSASHYRSARADIDGNLAFLHTLDDGYSSAPPLAKGLIHPSPAGR